MRSVLLLALPLVAACTTVEGTGRKQVNFYSREDEVALGREAYEEELKGATILPEADPRTQRVRAIGRRIEAAARQRQPGMAGRMEWTWTVVDDPKVINAWMVPGGRAAVYTGMIDFVKSDDELAVIMGHEASHAIARHGTERMSQGALVGAGVAATGAATGSSAAQEGAAMAANLLINLPHSRDQEIEADEMGLMTAAQAGYDPRTAIDLWRRMQSRGGSPPEFLSTHPSEGTRIERLQALMPQAHQLYKRSAASGAAAPATSAASPRSR
jgi:predicted Zn-dependent protease